MNFLTGISDCDFDHIIASVLIFFPFGSKGDAPFHCTVFAHSYVDCFCDHIRDNPWKDIFNLGDSKFCK